MVLLPEDGGQTRKHVAKSTMI